MYNQKHSCSNWVTGVDLERTGTSIQHDFSYHCRRGADISIDSMAELGSTLAPEKL